MLIKRKHGNTGWDITICGEFELFSDIFVGFLHRVKLFRMDLQTLVVITHFG